MNTDTLMLINMLQNGEFNSSNSESTSINYKTWIDFFKLKGIDIYPIHKLTIQFLTRESYPNPVKEVTYDVHDLALIAKQSNMEPPFCYASTEI